MLTIFVTNYWQLFVLRLLTGIALGGALELGAGRADCESQACSVELAAAHNRSICIAHQCVCCAACHAPSGALPVVFSLLGDLYDPSARVGVSSIVQLSTGVGLAFGQGIAGFVGPAVGWRWPFVIVSVPAVAGGSWAVVSVSLVVLAGCGFRHSTPS